LQKEKKIKTRGKEKGSRNRERTKKHKKSRFRGERKVIEIRIQQGFQGTSMGPGWGGEKGPGFRPCGREQVQEQEQRGQSKRGDPLT